MMYGDWMGAHGWGAWTMFGGVMVLFWAAVITAVVLAVRYTGRPTSYGLPRPEDVLAERFARGEIDEDEYRRRVTLLDEIH